MPAPKPDVRCYHCRAVLREHDIHAHARQCWWPTRAATATAAAAAKYSSAGASQGNAKPVEEEKLCSGSSRSNSSSSSSPSRVMIVSAYSHGYTLLLAVPHTCSFAMLDALLRDVWLECCLHLSQFTLPRATTRSRRRSSVSSSAGHNPASSSSSSSSANLEPAVVAMATSESGPSLSPATAGVGDEEQVLVCSPVGGGEGEEEVIAVAGTCTGAAAGAATVASVATVAAADGAVGAKPSTSGKAMSVCAALQRQGVDSFRYEYDFAQPTHITFKVDSFDEPAPAAPAHVSGSGIILLARNMAPAITCSRCHQSRATRVCTRCHATQAPAAYVCASCVHHPATVQHDGKHGGGSHDEESKEDSEHVLRPLVNSPRHGVCAYDGRSGSSGGLGEELEQEMNRAAPEAAKAAPCACMCGPAKHHAATAAAAAPAAMAAAVPCK